MEWARGVGGVHDDDDDDDDDTDGDDYNLAAKHWHSLSGLDREGTDSMLELFHVR